ncbi:hypothetical protein [Methanoculleus bourgensis]|uniref:hypothetical protein n=1 Tax=Methanoculleus bourgensis TaxID=83986 RepID=UPI0012F6F458|nr:hypothetical protein [Methanoculleus bourgensis]
MIEDRYRGLASFQCGCPSRAGGIPGRSVYENDDRLDGSSWMLRWDWNDASFCMMGSLSVGEVTRVVASAIGWLRSAAFSPLFP